MTNELRTKIIELLKRRGNITNFDISSELGVNLLFEVEPVLDQMIKRGEVIILREEGMGDRLVALNPNFKI